MDLNSNAALVAARGISPRILLDQVRNTAPFIFAPDFSNSRDSPDSNFPHNAPYLAVLRETDQELSKADALDLSHPAYYKLCLSAHYATVATFVPTDVDGQIRFKLWNPVLAVDVLEDMARIVCESRDWDCRAASTRWVKSPVKGKILSGHLGEWFSTAAGAYCALRKRSKDLAAEVAGMILTELQEEADAFTEFKQARDGIGLLKVATIIAHNLGDLDRVMDAWNLHPDDPLRIAAYKAGHGSGTLRCGKVLTEAGSLNKAMMAVENHRHFILRTPRSLRKSHAYLLPIAPFLDDWGSLIARHPGLKKEEVAETVEALALGWERLQKGAEPGTAGPVGYSRALAGIIENFPGGMSELANYVPARVIRDLKSGPLRTQCAISKRRFEEQWNQKALNFRSH